MNKKKTIVGIRPTGKLHIGHYFSVIRPALEENADVLIADYHGDWRLSHKLYEQLNSYEVYKINFQAHTFQAKLYFSLLKVAKIGELKRMTQFKNSKVQTAHLLTYPVLMAHDLRGYDRVIVGDDQKQHVEYANVLFKRLGLPKIKGDYRSGRIMDLQKPTKKMSKSNPKGCLFLEDDFEKKIMKAVTTPAGIRNLTQLAKRFGIKWNTKNNEYSKKRLFVALNRVFKC